MAAQSPGVSVGKSFEQRVESAAAGVFGLIIIGGFLGGIAVLGWQCWHWLRYGWWRSMSLADGLVALDWPRPTTTWGGVQKTIDGALDLPLCIALPLVATGGGVLVTWLWGVVKKEVATLAGERPHR
jgi:hypothetical protein